MTPLLKKRRTESKQPAPSPAVDIDKKNKSTVLPPVDANNLDPKIQQAKKTAVAQAQQEGCVGNFRSFDSPYGNYLVPVVPTLSDLNG
ncbi:hypothetical protein QJS04_geneDACA002628 [Acorus gramineus]|uniref:Uncharacterized protein n=1 Tax=Acorus gramineus TaxID=55184 RepID=A0AAV9ARK5_ACOGR|nr:hypothetical protein QJS04_geneDACA002628 [Acorus gramineus]